MLLLLTISILLLATAVISIYSLLGSPWTSFQVGPLKFTNSLLHSITAPAQYHLADYKCIEALSCGDSGSPDLCEISQQLELSTNVYLALEAVSLCIAILILERIILKIFNRPNGSAGFFLFLIWIFPLVKCAGIACYLLISNIHVDKKGGNGEVNSEIGVDLSFASVGICILVTVIMLIGKVHRTKITQKLQITVKTTRFINPLIMFLISQTLMILSRIYPTASFKEFSNVTLNVYSVEKIDSYAGLSIACIAGIECQPEFISQAPCRIFNSLNSVSKVMIFLETASSFFLLLWLESLVHLLLKIRLGTNFCNYMYPVVCLALSITSLIFYIVKSNISYGAKCSVENFEHEWSLCAELGTTFYIISQVIVGLTVITYEIVYMVHAITSAFGTDTKVYVDPEDLKQKNHMDNYDFKKPEGNETHVENSAANTNSDVKNVNTKVSSRNIIVDECFRCKIPFKSGENGITEGGSKFHFKCFILSTK